VPRQQHRGRCDKLQRVAMFKQPDAQREPLAFVDDLPLTGCD